MQKRRRAKKINYSYDCTDVSAITVYADIEKIKNVLTELIDNAIKYTAANGKIDVVLSEAEPLANGYRVFRIIVSDNGKGISESALPHIFNPFERESSSTLSGVFGSGLGLTLAKTLAEAMGGKISVKSVLGEGSTFTVTFGCRPCRVIGSGYDSDTILKEIKRRKILIVEDNEINLEIESEILEDYGFSVESAENGQVAIDKLIAGPDDYYAVVLMDIQMPVMDGRKAAEIIRGLDNPVLSKIPIIALSANAFESDKRLSAKAGIDAHLPKPLDMRQLLDTMSDIVYLRMKE